MTGLGTWLPEAVMNFFGIIWDYVQGGLYIAIVASVTALGGIGVFLLIKKVIYPGLVGVVTAIKSTLSSDDGTMDQFDTSMEPTKTAN